MYTLPKDTKITNSVLQDVIGYNEKYEDRYKKLGLYYLGKHDIFNREKDSTLINNKINGK